MPDPVALEDLARRLAEAANPVLIAGPDIDASGGWDAAVALAEKQRLAVWATPAPGGGRLGFPEDHPGFLGILPPAIGPASETLKGHDLVLVVGSSVFPYYPYIPGPLLPEGASLVQITSDPGEAARAPMGSAIVGDVALALQRLLELLPVSERAAPEPRALPGEPARTEPISGSAAMSALAEVWPEDGIAVVETPSSTVALRNRLRLSRPGSYYFSSSGGLGFGIAASVGVQLAQPDRPVVCVLGEGSAQYGITALWSAAAYRVPVTFLVLRNEEYMILKWFAEFEQAAGVPGLDLAGLDVASVAEAYGSLPGGDHGRGAHRGDARRDSRAGRPAARAGAGGLWHVAGLTRRCSEPTPPASRPRRQRRRRPRTRLGGGRDAAAAARTADGRPRSRSHRHARTRPRALRLRRQPLPLDPQRRGAPARHRRRGGAVRPRAQQRNPDRVPRRGDEPQRAGPDRRDPRGRAPALEAGEHRAGRGARALAARRRAREREPQARAPPAQARARSREHRHRLRRRRPCQQLRRHALRRACRLLQHRALADVRAAQRRRR